MTNLAFSKVPPEIYEPQSEMYKEPTASEEKLVSRIFSYPFVKRNKDLIGKYVSRLPRNEFSSNKTDTNNFSPKFEEGYGDSYETSTTTHPYAKNMGVSAIASFLKIQDTLKTPLILDTLGGSGQLRCSLEQYVLGKSLPNIVTADIEISQIHKAHAKGFVALPLDASNMSLIKDKSFDVVVFAYGFHHIPPNKYLSALKEAKRVVRSGGFVLLHEGPLNTMTEKLSTGIVDRLGRSPHLFPHPHRSQIESSFKKAGFEVVEEHHIFDPHVITADTTPNALCAFRNYYRDHYGLPNFTPEELWEKVNDLYKGHTFPPEEISKLVTQQKWIKEKPYFKKAFAGPVDNDLRKALSPSTKSQDVVRPQKHAVVISRFASLYKSYVHH